MNIGGQNKFDDFSMLAIMLGCLMEEKPDNTTKNIIKNLVIQKINEGAPGNAVIEDDCCDKMLVNPMWIAIERGWVGLIEKMLQNGFDVDCSHMPRTLISPLYYAVKCCQYEAVKCLLEADMDVNDYPDISEAGGVFQAETTSILSQAINSIKYLGADERMLEIILDYGGEPHPHSNEMHIEEAIFKYSKRRIAMIAINLVALDLPVLLIQLICKEIMGPNFFPDNLTISWKIIQLIKNQSHNYSE